MANVKPIGDFIDALNTAIRELLEIREDLAATDRLWNSLDAKAKADIKAALELKLVTAKAKVTAVTVP